MKALVGAVNQEKALVGAFSVIVQPVVEPMDRFTALIPGAQQEERQPQADPVADTGRDHGQEDIPGDHQGDRECYQETSRRCQRGFCLHSRGTGDQHQQRLLSCVLYDSYFRVNMPWSNERGSL